MSFVIPALGDTITNRRCAITFASGFESRKRILVACFGGRVTITTGTSDFLRHLTA